MYAPINMLSVSVVSQFMHNPSESHMDVVVRILRYLKSVPKKVLYSLRIYSHLDVNGYTNADCQWLYKCRLGRVNHI